jgi:hypothetical protein
MDGAGVALVTFDVGHGGPTLHAGAFGFSMPHSGSRLRADGSPKTSGTEVGRYGAGGTEPGRRTGDKF